MRVNGEIYSTLTVPYTETQASSTAIVSAVAGNTTIDIINSSAAAINLPDTGIQSKITIVGYKSGN